jgi:hypothetical protein
MPRIYSALLSGVTNRNPVEVLGVLHIPLCVIVLRVTVAHVMERVESAVP